MLKRLKTSERPIALHNQYNIIFVLSAGQVFATWLPLYMMSVLSLGLLAHRERFYVRHWLTEATYFFGIPFKYNARYAAFVYLRNQHLLVRIALIWMAVLLLKIELLSVNILPGLPCLAILAYLNESVSRFRKHRFHLNHTSWNGERCVVQCTSKTFLLSEITGLVFTMLSLGLYAPRWRNRRYAQYVNLHFGDLKLHYTGTGRDVVEDYASLIPATIITAGITQAWLNARISRYRMAHTWLGGDKIGTARGFYLTTGRQRLLSAMHNMAAMVLSLGLAKLWVVTDHWQTLTKNFAFIGHLDLLPIDHEAPEPKVAPPPPPPVVLGTETDLGEDPADNQIAA